MSCTPRGFGAWKGASHTVRPSPWCTLGREHYLRAFLAGAKPGDSACSELGFFPTPELLFAESNSEAHSNAQEAASHSIPPVPRLSKSLWISDVQLHFNLLPSGKRMDALFLLLSRSDAGASAAKQRWSGLETVLTRISL